MKTYPCVAKLWFRTEFYWTCKFGSADIYMTYGPELSENANTGFDNLQKRRHWHFHTCYIRQRLCIKYLPSVNSSRLNVINVPADAIRMRNEKCNGDEWAINLSRKLPPYTVMLFSSTKGGSGVRYSKNLCQFHLYFKLLWNGRFYLGVNTRNTGAVRSPLGVRKGVKK